jgi:hypothetical protein|eukprot:COSAG03_NODE_1136_length_4743_cov_16.292420_4_plen_136_part_00
MIVSQSSSDKESHWWEQVEKAGRGENGWKASNEIIPSSVAAFIVIFALNVKDRHKGNMVVTGGNKLANIDFGCARHLFAFPLVPPLTPNESSSRPAAGLRRVRSWTQAFSRSRRASSNCSAKDLCATQLLSTYTA